jgi:hypothetical protein
MMTNGDSRGRDRGVKYQKPKPEVWLFIDD